MVLEKGGDALPSAGEGRLTRLRARIMTGASPSPSGGQNTPPLPSAGMVSHFQAVAEDETVSLSDEGECDDELNTTIVAMEESEGLTSPVPAPRVGNAGQYDYSELLRQLEARDKLQAEMQHKLVHLTKQVSALVQELTSTRKELETYRQGTRTVANLQEMVAPSQQHQLLVRGGRPRRGRRVQERKARLQKQQQQQQQPQSGYYDALDHDAGPSFAEVVRRKNHVRRNSGPKQQQQHQRVVQQQQQQQRQQKAVRQQQQQQQQQQQRAGQQQQQRAGEQQQQQQQQNTAQQQQQPRKPAKVRSARADQIDIAPAEGTTWTQLYLKLRTAPELEAVRQDIGMGRRTGTGHLRVPIKRLVDSQDLSTRIQQVLDETGVSRVVTEMGEILVTNVDALATKEDVKQAIEKKLGVAAGITFIDDWELSDGTKRTRVRLLLSKAQHLYGQKLEICYCISTVREVPKRPIERQRCYRCLLWGHHARDCSSSTDRKGMCIQCGVAGHQAKTCTAEVRCILCNGPHRIGHPSCVVSSVPCRV
uniref:CCHC-type domain-containing protein n=1 Tax=Anopheles maculatus TaxID=74869 RepID=A0A182SNU6_9DIPT